MVLGYVAVGLVLIAVSGAAAFWMFSRRRPAAYGYVIKKRIQSGTAYRSVASVAMGTAPMIVIPPSYQLLLERKNERPNWHNVTREQYERVQVGELWWPDK